MAKVTPSTLINYNDTVITGIHYRNLLLSGCILLLNNKYHLNKINIFPVPDGDTGTNMSCCYNAIYKYLLITNEENISILSNNLLNIILYNSRGNSGAYICKFFHQLNIKLNSVNYITTIEFLSIIKHVGNYLSNSLEGTMAWVIYASSLEIDKFINNINDFNISELFNAWSKAANEQLLLTPDKLIQNGELILKKYNVVDSGAQGWVYMIDGMANECNGIHIEKTEIENDLDLALEAHDDHDPLYRYCTEFLVEMNGLLSEDELKNQFTQFGDSIVCLAVDKIGKVHIHTNDPTIVFKEASHIGNIKKRKVEDMKSQVHASAIKDVNSGDISVIFDSTTDIPTELLAHLSDFYMVPCRVHINGDVDGIRDKIDIQSEEFFELLNNKECDLTTSGSSVGDWKNVITKAYNAVVEKNGHVVIITVSKFLSAGTWSSLQLALEIIKDSIDLTKIHVIDSSFVSAAAAHLVLKTVDMVREQKNIDFILTKLEDYKKQINLNVTFENLDHAIKSGRVSSSLAFFLNCMGLRPIMNMQNGLIRFKEVAFSGNRAKDCILGNMVDEVPLNSNVYIHFAHSGRPDLVGGVLENEIKSLFEAKNCVVKTCTSVCIGPVLGSHCGNISWAVSVMWD